MEILNKKMSVEELITTTPIITNNRIFIDCKNFIEDLKKIYKAMNNVEFVIDNNNEDILYHFEYYLSGNEKFKGDFKKGILLTGGYGSGKTSMMTAICKYIEMYGKVFKVVNCSNIASELKGNGFEYFEKRPILLDDLGRENTVIKDFGTDVYPIIEILSARYNLRAWTFATSNFMFESLREKYGGYIADRMIEMFNFIELKGKSKRK